MKVIFHIDLNSFFAMVEQIIRPELDGKPIAVGHDNKKSVVSSASYEARALGIKSAMPIYKVKEIAKQKNVHIEIVASNFKYYTQFAAIFFNFLAKNYTDKIEIASIDECFVDVTDIWMKYGKAVDLAQDVMDKLFKETKLKCSIGIAPNKFLAKVASDIKKPMGITILNHDNMEQILWPMPIEDYWGIGRKTAPKLRELGINTIGDLAKSIDNPFLEKILGKNFYKTIKTANGISEDELDFSMNDLKSVGNSVTFMNNTDDKITIRQFLSDLSGHVAQRAQVKDLIGKTISISMKDESFKSITRQLTLNEFTNDYSIIYTNALRLFEDNWDGRILRHVGVALGDIKNKYKVPKQISIFESEDLSDVERVIERINEEFGFKALQTTQRYKDTINKKYQSKYLEKDDQTHWRLHNQK